MEMRIATGCVAYCGGSCIGGCAPANVSDGESVHSFDSPPNVDIRRTPFFGRSRPVSVDADAAEPLFVLHNVGANAVGMGKWGSRIGADAAKNFLRLAKPITEGIEVMDGHDPEGEPAEALVPVHPMGDAAHFD